jgi:hypothetical protein
MRFSTSSLLGFSAIFGRHDTPDLFTNLQKSADESRFPAARRTIKPKTTH